MSLVPEAFKSALLNAQEVYALQSLEEGTADVYAQRLALSAILNKLCRVYDQHYVPGDRESTTFLLGRAYPGQEIIKHLRINPTQLKALEEANKNGN